MKKINVLNLLIAVVGILLVISLVSTLMVWLSPNNDIDDPNGNDDPSINETNITVNQYTLYEDEDLSFRFILANITLTSDEPQNVAINRFVTSQQVNLADVQSYLDDLLVMDIDLTNEDYNLDFTFFETTDEITLNLFIPLRVNESETLTVFFQGEQEVSVLFDLTTEANSLAQLKDDNNDNTYIDEIIEEDLYSIKIISVSEITYSSIIETLEDGSQVDMVLPSTARVIGVLVEIEALGLDPIYIEGARFNIPSDNQVSQAFDDSIEVVQFDNLFNVPVISEASGFIFFDVYVPDPSIINNVTEFEFKLNVVDQWITVQVDAQ